MEETHDSLGQCVSFSLIDVGNGFAAYVVFLFLSFSLLQGASRCAWPGSLPPICTSKAEVLTVPRRLLAPHGRQACQTKRVV